jgi:hypothetical protein
MPNAPYCCLRCVAIFSLQFGDVFCLPVLHQRMVFIFDPAMLSLFFKAPESHVSFK